MARLTLRRAALPSGPATQEAEIVLCYLSHNTFTPFVTWQRNIADGGTYWGHYFKTYAEAEEDFRNRAVRLHAKVRKPFNLDAHEALVAEGFMLTQHDEDWHDGGDAESGPKLEGGPAWDEYESADYMIVISERGIVEHHAERNLAHEIEFSEYVEAQSNPMPVNSVGSYYSEDGTLMNADGTRSIFDDVDK